MTICVDNVLKRARAAQAMFAQASQQAVDVACLAVAAPLMREDTNRCLSAMAVAETQFGCREDKARKNYRKTLGLLRDIRGQKTVGVIAQDASRGIVEIARPLGVVAALTPSTNPVSTCVNKTVNALKGANAIVLSPPPTVAKTGAMLLSLMRAELACVGAPPDLVQMLLPPSKTATADLMRGADFVFATGSQRNVLAASQSATPAIGVGVGNVAVIVDESADITDAAAKVAASKTFDNATSCSAENHLVIVDAVYDEMVRALQGQGAVLLSVTQKATLQQALWVDGTLNRTLIARSMSVMAKRAGLPASISQARFTLVEEDGVGADFPFSGEKLSLVLTLYRVADFAAAVDKVAQLLAYQGKGHSVGIHTQHADRPVTLGLTLPACRILANQAHCLAHGGSFDNSLPFSLSMGCGSWGGNAISDNLNWRHFINTVRVVYPIESTTPTVEALYANYPGRKPSG